MKKVFEPVTNTNNNTSENLTKTITDTSTENNRALENLNNKRLEIMNDRGILATCLISKTTNPENSTHLKLLKDSSSNRVNDLLMKKTKPITLHDSLLTFRDTGKVIELKGDLLRMITNKNYNVDLASLVDKNLLFDFAKEMLFDKRGIGNTSTRDRTLIKLLKSPAILASGVSTIFSPSNPGELCDRLKLLLQDKQAENNSDINNEEIIAIVKKLIEYKRISKKNNINKL